MVENVCQVIEEKAHGVFATWIKKERHGEEGVIEAKEKEPESIKSQGTYVEVCSSEVPVGDRGKTTTTAWDVVEKDNRRIKSRVCVRVLPEKSSHRGDSPITSKEWKGVSLDVSTTFLQGDPIDGGVNNEQSHFRKLVENINWLATNIRPDLYLDAMEMACDFEKEWIKDIKKAGRILKKAKERGNDPQSSNPGDSKEAVLMEWAGRW